MNAPALTNKHYELILSALERTPMQQGPDILAKAEAAHAIVQFLMAPSPSIVEEPEPHEVVKEAPTKVDNEDVAY